MRDHDSEKAAADYSGLSVATLRKRRRLGLPPAFIRVGRRVIYSRSDVNLFLAAQRVVPTTSAPPKQHHGARGSALVDEEVRAGELGVDGKR